MRRTSGQSERQVVRHVQFALAVLGVLLAGLLASGLWAVAANRVEDEWLALLILVGSAAVATGAWLFARIPAEMRSLAGERRQALDDLLRAEEVERERIATELHEDTMSRWAGSKEPARRAEDRPRALLHVSLERLGERVRLADGDVEIRSIPGRGTLVAFRLPLSTGAEADEDLPATASAG